MRVTCDPGSVDFWPFIFTECPTVHLDGQEMRRVCAADDDAGWVEFYPVNSGGAVGICASGERAVVSLAFGRVEICGARRAKRIIPECRA